MREKPLIIIILDLFTLILIVILGLFIAFNILDYKKKIAKIPENIKNEVMLKEQHNRNIKEILGNFKEFEDKIVSTKKSSGGNIFYYRNKNKYTFLYVIKEDNLEKEINTSNFKQQIQDEKEIKKEFVLKDKEGLNIDYYVSQCECFRTNQYTFKKIVLDVGNSEAKEFIFKNQDFNQYLKEIDYNKIKEEIEKEFIENNKLLKQYKLEVKEK